MTHFRVRWKRLGDHVHTRVFVAKTMHDGFAMSGTLVFREAEWESFLRCFNDYRTDTISIIPEDGQP